MLAVVEEEEEEEGGVVVEAEEVYLHSMNWCQTTVLLNCSL